MTFCSRELIKTNKKTNKTNNQKPQEQRIKEPQTNKKSQKNTPHLKTKPTNHPCHPQTKQKPQKLPTTLYITKLFFSKTIFQSKTDRCHNFWKNWKNPLDCFTVVSVFLHPFTWLFVGLSQWNPYKDFPL